VPPPTPGWVAAPKSAWEAGSKSDAPWRALGSGAPRPAHRARVCVGGGDCAGGGVPLGCMLGLTRCCCCTYTSNNFLPAPIYSLFLMVLALDTLVRSSRRSRSRSSSSCKRCAAGGCARAVLVWGSFSRGILVREE